MTKFGAQVADESKRVGVYGITDTSGVEGSCLVMCSKGGGGGRREIRMGNENKKRERHT
jgi:hypothetical protein